MIYLLWLFLIISIALNVALVWYLRQLAQNYTNINSDVQEVRSKTESIANHVESVYNMDRIYGDSIIEGMINHMKEYSEYLNSFTERFTLSLEDQDNEEEEEIN